MQVNVTFDEQPVIKELLDGIIAEIEAEFHKVFPRLRRDELEAQISPEYKTMSGAEAPIKPEITPTHIPLSAYVIKDKPTNEYFLGTVVTEGFYFISIEKDGSQKLTSYHVLETNNA